MGLDIFDVHCSVIQACGCEPKVTPQRDDSLLVEVASPDEATRLRARSAVPGAEVFCTPHTTFNQCKGAVYCRDILHFSEERLMREMKKEGVVAVHRFQKVDGILKPTPFLHLTISALSLPQVV